MKITREDIRDIIYDVWDCVDSASTNKTLSDAGRKEDVILFLWYMYQELTENKGE